MKKHYLILALLTLSIALHAQEMNNIAKAGLPDLATDQTEKANIIKEPTRLNEINIKAVRAFAKEYKDVHDAKWYKGDNWLAAYFTKNNVSVKVFYDCSGSHKYTLRSYDESVLPQEVRHQVKSTHYDFNIFRVTEVTTREAVFYYIKLEGKHSWKDVRVVNNEMENLHEFTKS